MLTRKTKLAASTIHGIGLFADEAIKQGEIIWQFQPGFDMELTSEQRNALPQVAQDWFQHYGYLDYHLEKHMCCVDDARFMNHSDSPNVTADYETAKYGVGRALMDIKVGDELTIDYRQIENVSWLQEKK